MTITLTNCAGQTLLQYDHDTDPYAGARRVILQNDTLFGHGQVRERRKTLACSLRLHTESGKPVAHHIPESTERILVESASYRARYRVERLVWRPIELFLPQDTGDNKFGDFSGWELQRYQFEWAYPPIGWSSESGWLYVRWGEDSPFQHDDETAQLFTRALVRSRFDWNDYKLLCLGRNLTYGRLLRDQPVVSTRPTPKKRTGVRQ
jgi:hypothetical protein